MNECNNYAAEIVLGVPKETPNTISEVEVYQAIDAECNSKPLGNISSEAN